LIICHPVVAVILVTIFIIIAVWFLKKMFKYLKKVFNFSGRGKFKKTGLENGNMKYKSCHSQHVRTAQP